MAESNFQQRIEHLRDQNIEAYSTLLVSKVAKTNELNHEIREIVFDFFNIINKEYEISFEKWKLDELYKASIDEIKTEVDKEYGDK